MNVFMQVVESMESSLEKCRANWIDAIGAWDEAIAYYVGSIAKTEGGDEGYFPYSTAEKRCRNFETCSNSGVSNVNVEIMEMFQAGQESLSSLDCETAAEAKAQITDLMVVPLVQGLLRDAYYVDKQDIVDDRADASGATYAAAVLPFVHACNQNDARIIHNNMGIGQSDKPNFDNVKAAFERNYACMGISCADIGGLINSSTGDYYEDAAPCDDIGIQTDAPTTADDDVVSDENAISVTSAPSEFNCPPCASAETNLEVTISRSAEVCTDLVSDQMNIIPDSCECACFADGQYIFCAEQQLLYTGSGSMVGPCQISAVKDTTGEGTILPSSNTTAPFATNETSTDGLLTDGLLTDGLLPDDGDEGLIEPDLEDEEKEKDDEEPEISLATEDSSAIRSQPRFFLMAAMAAVSSLAIGTFC
jgi:hypothetical protein